MSSHDERRAVGGEALRLARLFRVAGDAELSDAARGAIKAALIAELGAAALPPDLLPDLQPRAAAASHGKIVTRQPAAGESSDGDRETPIDDRVRRIEMRLRHLTDADAGWGEIGPLALEHYRLRPGPATAARTIELAFLNADQASIEELIKRFRGEQPRFWQHAHKAVRSGLTVRLWRSGVSDVLAALLYRERDESYLQPIERLCVFWSLRGARDKTPALLYYRAHKDELAQAAATLGDKVGLPPSLYFLEVGRLAADAGDPEEAREALEAVSSQEPERDEALRLLLDVAVERNRAGRSHYMELIESARSDVERVGLLGKFLDATRGLGGFRDRNRPALNELLLDPLSWIGEEPESWRSLSETLVAARDLEPLLPNLFEVFRKNAERFYAPLLDAALWQGPLQCAGDEPRELYWRGVGLLHHYVNCGANQEEALWQARDCVAQAKRRGERPVALQWRELHKAAYAWVAKNHYLIEPDRQRMLRQMRIAVDTAQCVTRDVEDYLDHGDRPPLGVLAALQRIVRDKKEPGLELRLIVRRAAHAHLTNADLARVWQLANERKDADLAWRVASVLQARTALVPQVRAAWEISGEKRKQYSLLPVPKALVDSVLAGFDPQAARLCHASLVVGAALPELLFLLDKGGAAIRGKAPPADSVEGKVDAALDQLGWLAAPRRRYRFSFESAPLGGMMPQFIQVLPANAWSAVVARLSERLGVNAWGWKLSRLSQQIEGLIPRIASRQDLRRRSGKVADWLKALTPEQRAAWQDMALLARSLDDERATLALAAFICRLATLIYQNHYMALQSLQTMRAPIEIIWDLERFLLSPAYARARKELGAAIRVPVPNALQRLTSIVTATSTSVDASAT